MSQGLVERQHLQDIGDAIRSKNGSSDTYTPAEMAQAISGIRTADEVVLVQKTVNANGQYNSSDDSADGYSGVRVNVPNSYSASDEGKVVSNGDLISQTSRNVNANGTYDTTVNNEMVVAVPEPIIIQKTITENGTYNASSDGADGYSSVSVNVSGGGGGGTDIYEITAEDETDTYLSFANVYKDNIDINVTSTAS